MEFDFSNDIFKTDMSRTTKYIIKIAMDLEILQLKPLINLN